MRSSPTKSRANSAFFQSQKAMNSTSSSFGGNNSRGNAFRTISFSHIKNTQGKLGNLKEELNYIHQDILSVRNTTKVFVYHIIVSCIIFKIHERRFKGSQTPRNRRTPSAINTNIEKKHKNWGTFR